MEYDFTIINTKDFGYAVFNRAQNPPIRVSSYYKQISSASRYLMRLQSIVNSDNPPLEIYIGEAGKPIFKYQIK